MLSRRELIGGGVVGSLAGPTGSDVAAEAQIDAATVKDIKDAINQVQSSIDRAFNTISLSNGYIVKLRELFEQFLRSNGKFPDFCEIGANVFYDVYDWHVRNRLPFNVMRQADNRYTIQFMFTTLILRFENQTNFIGYPYDKA
jgi:hypothetical protein